MLLKHRRNSVCSSVFFAFLNTLFAINGYAQTVIGFGKTNSGAALTSFTLYAGGTSTVYTQYEDVVEGSAFFNNAFAAGKVILNNGQLYDSLSLRLDLLDNSVHFINSDGQESMTNRPIKTILLYDFLSQQEYRFDHSTFISPKAREGWYQLLDSGAVQLYKQYFKTIREDRAYNSSKHEKFITTTIRYYVCVNTLFTQVKNIKSIPDMLQSKKPELLAYISDKNLTGKTDADYIELLKYYNKLIKER